MHGQLLLKVAGVSRWGVPDLDEDKDELSRAVAPALGAGQGLLWANLLAKKRTPKLLIGSAAVGAASFSLMDTIARRVRQGRRVVYSMLKQLDLNVL